MNPTASYVYGSRHFTPWALLDFVKLICYLRFNYPGSSCRKFNIPWSHVNHFYSMPDPRDSLKQ